MMGGSYTHWLWAKSGAGPQIWGNLVKVGSTAPMMEVNVGAICGSLFRGRGRHLNVGYLSWKGIGLQHHDM